MVMSVVVHEVSHGYAAYLQGDSTARYEGRLTLNPIKHLDLFGSIIIPLLLIVTKAGFVFGWAKPVPYNPYNLRNHRWGEGIVAAAGPFSNIVLALIFGLLIRISIAYGFATQPFLVVCSVVVAVNIMLAIFNLIPIPPLDGSKILFSFLSYKHNNIRVFLESFGMFLVLFFIIFLSGLLLSPVTYLFHLFTGLSL